MIYIVLVDLFSKGYMGIKKKVFAQMKVFKQFFSSIYYTSYSGQMVYLMSEGKILEKELAITKEERNQWILKWIQKYGIQSSYIRYNYSDKWFVWFVKELKQKNVITVLEFPTIPYDGEISNNRVRVEDQYYREQLSQHIEKCTTYANYDAVFGISCIPLLNGVDLDQRPIHDIRKPDGTIVLIAVATMNKWHGYERVIQGMANYYANNGTQDIIFRLVGEGTETDKYYQLVERYKLQEHVEFLGSLDGKELDRQYDRADIAIGTLAMYKINITHASPIKLGDYCARGIPFIYGYEDCGFSGEEEFALKVSNDSSPLDMKAIVDFYHRVKEHGFYVKQLRKKANEKYTWESILKKVVDYYKDK
ncbi:MAG: glycosyltransferase [Clostridium sp.]|nr:glycosyltransferase [Clostridium sp.]